MQSCSTWSWAATDICLDWPVQRRRLHWDWLQRRDYGPYWSQQSLWPDLCWTFVIDRVPSIDCSSGWSWSRHCPDYLITKVGTVQHVNRWHGWDWKSFVLWRRLPFAVHEKHTWWVGILRSSMPGLSRGIPLIIQICCERFYVVIWKPIEMPKIWKIKINMNSSWTWIPDRTILGALLEIYVALQFNYVYKKKLSFGS